MERKVARAQGERSQEETTKLEKEIAEEQKKLAKQQEDLRLLVTSNKQIEDEHRNIKREIELANIKLKQLQV